MSEKIIIRTENPKSQEERRRLKGRDTLLYIIGKNRLIIIKINVV